MNQSGAVLIISLVFLFALSLLSLTTLSTSLLETRMSNNFSTNLKIFSAAEAGLRAGEIQAEQSRNIHAPLFKSEDEDPWLTATDFENANYQGVKLETLVEELPDKSCLAQIDVNNQPQAYERRYYRITARAYFLHDVATVLQSTYVKVGPASCTPTRLALPQEINSGRLSWRQLE